MPLFERRGWLGKGGTFVPEPHGDRHPICPDCWEQLHPDEEPDLHPTVDAVRCEWCSRYTTRGIVEVCSPDDVPAHAPLEVKDSE